MSPRLDAKHLDRVTLAGTRYCEPSSALSRVLEEAPYLPRCSFDKTATLVRPRAYATQFPYMQINRSGMVSWLIFDLDHSDPLIWEKEGLPAPNIVVRNRNNGHSHLFYAIQPVCTTTQGRSKPIAYMKAVYDALAARLKADPCYRGPVAKTPGHPWWNTWEIHNATYDLGELADSVELAVKPLWSKGPDLNAVSHSRHCTLFEELRFFAYAIVNRERENGSFQSFTRCLEAQANGLNNFKRRGFDANLSVSQVKATVKSIARWTWDRYTGAGGCNRKAMNLDPSLPLPEKQRLAAERTHQVRRSATEKSILSAIKSLLKSGKGQRISISAVAALTNLSRQTVSKYRHLLENPSPSPAACPSNPVKYGVYQIAAGFGELASPSILGSRRCDTNDSLVEVVDDHEPGGKFVVDDS